MALATANCIGKKENGIFCMHGHDEGLIAYGRNLAETGELILKNYQKYIL